MKQNVINYEASNTCSEFHLSKASRRGIMGPVGSGKSVAGVMEIVMKAFTMPVGKNNVRKSRWAIIRNTYGELKSTTIKTWQEWVPDSDCPIVYDTPIRGKMIRKLPDGTSVDLEVYFIAINRPDQVKKLLSLELTGIFINEARELDILIVEKAFERTGRYPAKRHFSEEYIKECEKKNEMLYYSGLIMDTNPPATDHWWHRLAEEVQPDNWKFLRQPGALIKNPGGWYSPNPLAENVKNHPKGYNYWLDMIPGMNPDSVKVDILGEYGVVFDGRPVYKDYYVDSVHVSKTPLEIYRGLPLMLGFDFGMTPACVIAQYDKNGQLRILRELVSEYMPIRQFITTVFKPAILAEFAGMPLIGTADPSGDGPSDVDGRTCIQELNDSGIPTQPASTNVYAPRRQAVIDLLCKNIGEKPGLIIDPSCKMIKEGFQGGYKFKRVPIMGQERYEDKADKNEYSHIADAVQYLCLRIDNINIQEKKKEKKSRNSINFKQQVGWEGYA